MGVSCGHVMYPHLRAGDEPEGSGNTVLVQGVHRSFRASINSDPRVAGRESNARDLFLSTD